MRFANESFDERRGIREIRARRRLLWEKRRRGDCCLGKDWVRGAPGVCVCASTKIKIDVLQAVKGVQMESFSHTCEKQSRT